jgi:uroporphyrin-III C-methyltransferase
MLAAIDKDALMNDLLESLRFGFIERPAAASRPGKVTLVGAGPGDPELLTMRAWRTITQARIALIDALVSKEILDLLPRDAERIDVGKRCGGKAVPQNDTIALMLSLARSGRSVLRLKGGDPMIFGRGGEEAQALAAAGIAFEVVPGISAAQGAAALAGMPLTHRDHAQAVVFATAHLRDDAGPRPGRFREAPAPSGTSEHGERKGTGSARRVHLDWELLARPRQTSVIYMGVLALPEICAALTQHGLPAGTPAAVVLDISRPTMRTVAGTLETLPARAAAAAVRPPGLIIVGEVVALAEQLAPALHAAASVEQAAEIPVGVAFARQRA